MKSKGFPRINRNAWIASRIRDSDILHVGCTDWPLTEDRLRSNRLLHQELYSAARRCVGIDLDAVGIAALRRAFPSGEFHVWNAEELADLPDVSANSWDFIVAGDVVEHMSNPGRFFAAASRMLSADGTLIVTVPGAFSAKRFFWMLFTGKEQVHPDHVAYFSESTLRQLGGRYGLELSTIYSFQWHNPTLKNRLANFISMPLVVFSRGRCADELAVEFRRRSEG